MKFKVIKILWAPFLINAVHGPNFSFKCHGFEFETPVSIKKMTKAPEINSLVDN